MNPDRSELLEQLAALNDELRQRDAVPTYNVYAVGELLSDDELRRAVRQTMREVMALREAP